jgi:hypothetical protein
MIDNDDPATGKHGREGNHAIGCGTDRLTTGSGQIDSSVPGLPADGWGSETGD